MESQRKARNPMRHSAKLLSLATLTALYLPFDVSASQRPTQQSDLPKETGNLLTQAEPATNVLLEIDGVLEEGDNVFGNGHLVDTYTLQGQAGQSISINAQSSDFDTFVGIFLSVDDGVEEISVDSDTGSSETHSHVTARLPIGGTYIITVLASDSSDQGHYQLVVTEIIAEVDRIAEADYLLEQGIQQFSVSQFHSALRSWEQALVIYEELGDLKGKAITLSNIGSVHQSFGNYSEALEHLEQSLDLARELRDRAGEADTLNNIGTVSQLRGNYPEALNYYEQSLALARELGYKAGEARVINNIGAIQEAQGNYLEALKYHEQSLILERELGNRFGEAASLNNIGNIYQLRGNYPEALNYYEQSLNLKRELGDRAGEADTLSNIGIVYALFENYPEALDYYEQSLSLKRELGNRFGQAESLNNIGNIHMSIGNYSEALDFYEQSLDLTHELGNRAGEANILGNVGIIYRLLGQYDMALDYYERSLTLQYQLDNQAGEAITLGNIGNVHTSLGNYPEALNYYEQSLRLRREIGDRAGEASTLSDKGVTLNTLNNFAEATIVLQQSIDVYESLRDGLTDAQLISLADSQRSAYRSLEDALISQDEFDEALAITERGRGRAFVLQLASRLTTESERAALETSSVVKIPTVEEIQQIARDTNTTLVTYSIFLNQAIHIWVVQPSGDIDFRSVNLRDTVDGGLAINPIASIDGPVFRSASSESALTALVTDSRSAVNESGNPNTPQLQELHQVLIDPIADLLPSDPNAQVVFIPQGQLFLVPFAALQDEDGIYLIEKHTILTAPSIQVFGLANEAARTRNFASLPTDDALIVGNPTMPTVWLPNENGELAETRLSSLRGAKAEAESIGGFFNIPALTGEQATEARVKQLLPNASLIHLATHGLLEYGIPESSGVLDLPGAIALAPGNGEDGLLTSAEILEMDLQADLAILSACDTGRGRITGDGVVGLSRALITAGVPSVMVSLWAVNDDSTSLLMQRFYEFLATGEFTKAEALRQAQLSLLYDEDTETRLEAVRADISIETSGRRDVPTGSRHPYHWAPFILIGNGL